LFSDRSSIAAASQDCWWTHWWIQCSRLRC
jgi:hypothetical protein